MLRTCCWLVVLTCIAVATAPSFAADTLVVAAEEYREALADWIAYRTSQGHSIQVARPASDSAAMQALIREAATSGELRYVVLVGDAPARSARGLAPMSTDVPIAYVPAVINVAWGALPSIASDNPLADLDGDQSPDLAVGRIPCHSPVELKAYLTRVVDREKAAAPAKGLTVVASPGRFTPWLDAVIEMTAQRVLTQLTPADCPVTALHASPNSTHFPEGSFRDAVQQGLQQDGLAWVYMGHGQSQELDHLWDQPGAPSILTCQDLLDGHDGPSPTVAALLACRTGCLDDTDDCLAERMLLNPGGPLAVIASSRVCMPYGNSVVGAELLHCLFHHPGRVGDFFAEGKRRALLEDSGLPLRAALLQIGRGVSPNREALDVEVAEHVQMYNLLGDPLLRVR